MIGFFPNLALVSLTKTQFFLKVSLEYCLRYDSFNFK